MSEIDIDELKGYLRIDKHQLDRELEAQPELLFKISEAFVQASAHRDLLKEQLATVDAELFDEHRRKYLKSNTKSTDAMIKTSVQADDDHEKASTAYLEAKNKADLLLALKEAFQSRGYMIRDLCSLYTANYFEADSVKSTADTIHATYITKRAKRGKT
jgi:hypothetical protein